MKSYTPLMLIMLMFLFSCSKTEDSPYLYSNEETIYSEDHTTRFRELIVVLKPWVLHENQRKFIVTDTLFNVLISINGEQWGMFNSLAVDTSVFPTEVFNNFRVTYAEVGYGIVAPFQTQSDTLYTAGEYADLLNDIFTLEPGYYICSVDAFDIKDKDGLLTRVNTSIVEPLEIKENTRSALVGEFEVKIN